MTYKTTWQKIGRYVYGLVGLTSIGTLTWMIIKLVEGTFFSTMGFFGSLAFIILLIGGLNWGIKSIFEKDLFTN